MYEQFLLPETTLPQSTPSTDRNYPGFERFEKLENRYFANNFSPNDSNGPIDISSGPTINAESTNHAPFPPSTGSDYPIDRNLPFQYEILMIRGRQYNPNPVAPDGSPLPTPPEWIIISADPSIARFLPVRCEEAQGIIVARGQVAIQDGTLVPRLDNSPITLTIDEFHRGVLDFNLFVNPFNSCEKPNATPSEKPYRLFWNDDLIKNIRIFAQTTINRLFIQNKVNINANNTCNIYHVHNNFDFSN